MVALLSDTNFLHRVLSDKVQYITKKTFRSSVDNSSLQAYQRKFIRWGIPLQAHKSIVFWGSGSSCRRWTTLHLASLKLSASTTSMSNDMSFSAGLSCFMLRLSISYRYSTTISKTVSINVSKRTGCGGGFAGGARCRSGEGSILRGAGQTGASGGVGRGHSRNGKTIGSCNPFSISFGGRRILSPIAVGLSAKIVQIDDQWGAS